MKRLLLLFAISSVSAIAQTTVNGTTNISAANTVGLIFAVPPNATGATYTTDTAANFCQTFNSFGATVAPQFLVVVNKGSGTITIAGGTGVTISGTATIAVGASRLFMSYGTCGTTPSWTLQSLGGISSL
jgi:hypothetical protein